MPAPTASAATHLHRLGFRPDTPTEEAIAIVFQKTGMSGSLCAFCGATVDHDEETPATVLRDGRRVGWDVCASCLTAGDATLRKRLLAHIAETRDSIAAQDMGSKYLGEDLMAEGGALALAGALLTYGFTIEREGLARHIEARNFDLGELPHFAALAGEAVAS